MFSDNNVSPALQTIINELKTSFSPETLKICDKQISLNKINEIETIKIGVILSKCLELNGLPKQEYMKRLNRTTPKRIEQKNEKPIRHILTVAFEDLINLEKYTDASETLRTIFNYEDNVTKDCGKWVEEYSERLVNSIISLKFSHFYIVQLENSCYTLSILVYRFSFIFENFFKEIISYLLMIITECCSYVQEYVDKRNKKLNSSNSYDQDSDTNFHFPLFSFKPTICQNRLFSVAYFTIGFCFDCIIKPPAIVFLMMYGISTKEVSRFYIVSMFHNIILSLDKDKCKLDPEWMELPLKVHNEIIKFHGDRNSKIRELVNEINIFIRHCSAKRLPFLTKPVLETVDIMMQVIKRKNIDIPEVHENESLTGFNNWKKWLDLEKKVSKLSLESDSVESGTSKSKITIPSTFEDERDLSKDETIAKEEAFLLDFTHKDLHLHHSRGSFMLPDLPAIIDLSKLRTKKLRKNVKPKKYD